MKVQVQLFAVARELAGLDAVEVSLPEGASVADLRRALAAQAPSLAGILPQVLFAVGSDYVNDATPLEPETQLACIPPVSGG